MSMQRSLKSLDQQDICLHFWHMSHTVSIRLPEKTSQRLAERVQKTGRSRSEIVREVLDESLQAEPRAFMALAGSIEGAPNLSQRKGFAKK